MSGKQLNAKQQFGVKRKSRCQQLSLARSAIGKWTKSGGGDDGNSEASSTELSVSIS